MFCSDGRNCAGRRAPCGAEPIAAAAKQGHGEFEAAANTITNTNTNSPHRLRVAVRVRPIATRMDPGGSGGLTLHFPRGGADRRIPATENTLGRGSRPGATFGREPH